MRFKIETTPGQRSAAIGGTSRSLFPSTGKQALAANSLMHTPSPRCSTRLQRPSMPTRHMRACFRCSSHTHASTLERLLGSIHEGEARKMKYSRQALNLSEPILTAAAGQHARKPRIR